MAIKLDIVSLRDKLKKNIMNEVNKLDKKKLPNTVYIVSTIDDDASKVYMRNKLKRCWGYDCVGCTKQYFRAFKNC